MIITVLVIMLIILLWLFLNFTISFIWILQQPTEEMVDPQLSALFFPLFIRNCKQHRYERVSDKIRRNM